MRLDLTLAIFLALSSNSTAHFYDQEPYKGYYYFEDPSLEKTAPQDLPKTPEEAVFAMDQKKHTLYALRCLALLNPTAEHVTSYLEKHKETLSLSGDFALEWMHILLQNPDLGPSISNPSTGFGIHLKKELDQQEKSALLTSLRETHFLLLIGNGGDPWTEKAAEVARDFSAVTGLLAHFGTLNGEKVAAFDAAFPIEKMASSLKVTKVPAFFLMNPKTKQGYPLGVGALSIIDLIDNISFQAKRLSIASSK